MDAGKLAEKVGPELNVLPISPSVDESGARAVKEGSPAALGESVSLVDVGGGEGALDGEGDAELVGELGSEVACVVGQPLIHHAGVARVGEEVSVVAEKGADGADDLGGAAVLEEVDGDHPRKVINEVYGELELVDAERQKLEGAAEIGRDSLAEVGVDSAIGRLTRVTFAATIEATCSALTASLPGRKT